MPLVRHRKGKDPRSKNATGSTPKKGPVVGTKKKQQQQERPLTSNMDDRVPSEDIVFEEEVAQRSTTGRRRRRMIVWSTIASAILVGGIAAIVAVTWDSSSEFAEGTPNQPSHAIDAVPTPASVKPATTTSRYTTFGSFEVLETIAHNPKSFTQGFCLHSNNGTTVLYEGTGLYGQSVVQMVNISSGEVLLQRPMANQYFGEGLTYYSNTPDDQEGRLVQLTWKEQTGFVYDATTLQVLQQFTYTTSTSEGWGITYRNTTHTFVVSDGSDLLLMWNRNFTEIRRIPVTMRRPDRDNASSIVWLNELEWDPFTDTILANVWQQDVIVRIHPQTGFVMTVYDLSNLYPQSERTPTADVLNGIAVTNSPNVIWVTGKQWPYMYQIRLKH